MQVIKFNQLKLKNFKSHRDLTVEFGDTTKISGDNAQGKSSILEAITFTLYGLDPMGSKVDPSPIGYEFDEVLVELLLTIDEKQVLLGRGIKKNKATYYINEVPSKATEFNEIVDNLGDKEFVLSLLNPSYFPSLHWEKQRAMILQYVSSPASKDVLKHLPKVQGDRLKEVLKKHSLDDLQKIHKENKNKLDKAYIAAESKTKTLREQLKMLDLAEGDLEDLVNEEQRLREAIGEADKVPAEVYKMNQEYNKLQSEISMLQDQIDKRAEYEWPKLKNEVIHDTCPTCKRALDEESVKEVEASKEKRLADFKAEHNQIVAKRKALQEKLSTLQYIDDSEARENVRQLESERDKVADKIRTHKQHEQLLTQIEAAENDENEKLKSLNDSIFILDSIKAYKAKEAELQGDNVQNLFTTLSTKLFEEQKNGELKPTFEIEMDGKPYRKLSLSESIRAGLELREVLSEQSHIIAPCFVDNAESITKLKEPSGQLIISRVVAGSDLKIKSYPHFNKNWTGIEKEME